MIGPQEKSYPYFPASFESYHKKYKDRFGSTYGSSYKTPGTLGQLIVLAKTISLARLKKLSRCSSGRHEKIGKADGAFYGFNFLLKSGVELKGPLVLIYT